MKRSLRDAWVSAHQSVTEEVDVPLNVVEGALPPELRGVLFRNGPGRLERFGVPYGHLFDGDGHVLRFAFDGRTVRYRNRFVQTREVQEETRAGRILYRNFGTNRPGGLLSNLGRLRFKNVANTSVVYHAGRLLALWEAGLPHALDPDTLETLGRFDYDGRLLDRSLRGRMLGGELPFSAHPRVDPDTRELYNFGTRTARTAELLLYRVEDDGRMDAPEVHELDAMMFVHDFILTTRWRVFLLARAVLDAPAALLGLRTPMDAMSFSDTEPATVLLVPRDGGKATRLTLPACFVFHWVNGFDDGQRVVLDGCHYRHYPRLPGPFERVRGVVDPALRPHLTRFVLDPVRGVVESRLLSDHSAELPGFRKDLAGQPYRYAYAIGSELASPEPFSTGVTKVDAERASTLFADLGGLAGEPVFVPRPRSQSEDDGWVLSLVYKPDAHRSELYVLDGKSMNTVARLALPHHVPPGFHGTWVASRS